MSEHFSGGTQKTVAKLVILDWHLDAYTDVMGAWDTDPWYIDTHSGTGKTELRNGALVDGSTLRVLRNHENDFDSFYFYEIFPDHFDTLHNTLTNELDYTFHIEDEDQGKAPFRVAKCNDPYIRIMQTDSNQGVRFLTEHANDHRHWFVFIDPKGLSVHKDTVDELINRGTMDILINYQTTGVYRNLSEEAAGHEAIADVHGEEWDIEGDEDDCVQAYKERLEENEEWSPVLTKALETYIGGERHRFDLVFASAHEKARTIMQSVYDSDDLWDAATDEYDQGSLVDFMD